MNLQLVKLEPTVSFTSPEQEVIEPCDLELTPDDELHLVEENSVDPNDEGALVAPSLPSFDDELKVFDNILDEGNSADRRAREMCQEIASSVKYVNHNREIAATSSQAQVRSARKLLRKHTEKVHKRMLELRRSRKSERLESMILLDFQNYYWGDRYGYPICYIGIKYNTEESKRQGGYYDYAYIETFGLRTKEHIRLTENIKISHRDLTAQSFKIALNKSTEAYNPYIINTITNEIKNGESSPETLKKIRAFSRSYFSDLDLLSDDRLISLINIASLGNTYYTHEMK